MTVTLCVSLGGSRLEVGLMEDRASGSEYVGSGSVNWRVEMQRLSGTGAGSSKVLSELIGRSASLLIGQSRVGRTSGLNIGIAFPGPGTNKRWFSNNLTDDFREGVALDQILRRALSASCSPAKIQRLVIVLDAQADAGGELHHPMGTLVGLGQGESACVLNVATGVAAGFVSGTPQDSKLRVLRTASDFASCTAGLYDEGAGQLGRHLIVSIDRRDWTYHYRPHGGMADRVDGVRLTDYLSGPALTARLGLHLAERCEGCRLDGGVELAWLLREARRLLTSTERVEQPQQGCVQVKLTAHVRSAPSSVSAVVLDWADRGISNPNTEPGLRRLLVQFRDTVAGDFGKALATWQSVRGWDRLSRRIVLTGGVGQRLFRRSTEEFVSGIRSVLAPGTVLVRSSLEGGCERAAWFFHCDVFDDDCHDA